MKLSTSTAQQFYPISDTAFLHYLIDSLPSCVRGDSLILDSSRISRKALTVTGDIYNVSNVDGIQFFTAAPSISVSSGHINQLPHLASDSLISLYIANTHLKYLLALDSLPNMQTLEFHNDSLLALPDLSKLRNLINLVVYNEPIVGLPALDSLGQLLTLDIECGVLSNTPYINLISQLPNLSNNKNLRELTCYYCGLDSLPDLDSCALLYSIEVSGNKLHALPSLSNLSKLRSLACAYNYLPSLPELGQNIDLYWLVANNNRLDSLPDLSQNILINQMYLDSNRLTTLPDLSGMEHLEMLFASANRLSNLPVFDENSVSALDLSHNQLREFPVPYFISAYYWLLNDNLIQSLPDYYQGDSFDIIDISQNKLDFSDANGMKIINEMTMYGVDNNVQESNCCLYYLTADFSYSPQKPFGTIDTVMTDTYSDTSLHIAWQQYADSYQWYHADSAIPGATDTLLHIYCPTQADAGTYTCHSIGQYFNTHSFRFNYGVTEFVSEPQTLIVSPTAGRTVLAALYPAVSSGMVTLRYALPEAQAVTLQIYDMSGKDVYEMDMGVQAHSEYTLPMDLSGLASGSYIARVRYSLGYRQSMRLVILK